MNNIIRKKSLLSTLVIKNCQFIFILILFSQCGKNPESIQTYDSNKSKFLQLKRDFENSSSKKVLVVAHRGDWRNAPENSIQAVRNCITMGVDIVEIDVRKTKDNHLVVIHDVTLDRTTTGKGRISDWTLDSLKLLYLKNGLGIPTKHKIPTLEEVMLVAKDNILVNLDKSYKIFDEAHKVLTKTTTLDHVIMKSKYPREKVLNDYGSLMKQIWYMPVVVLEDEKATKIINSFSVLNAVRAYELVFKDPKLVDSNQLDKIKKNGSRVWVNTLWGSLCGNHEDDMAIYDLENSYGWVIEKGFNIIQTDRPKLLLDYLKSNGLHN